jgi:Na+/proline symporter
MDKKYLLINRLVVAVLAMVAIWTDSPVSEIAATLSTLLWVFMADVIRVEKKCMKRVKI